MAVFVHVLFLFSAEKALLILVSLIYWLKEKCYFRFFAKNKNLLFILHETVHCVPSQNMLSYLAFSGGSTGRYICYMPVSQCHTHQCLNTIQRVVNCVLEKLSPFTCTFQQLRVEMRLLSLLSQYCCLTYC